MRRLISAWLGRRELARAEAAIDEHPFSGPECDAAARRLVEASRALAADVVPGAGERLARTEDAAANRTLGFVACDTEFGHETHADVLGWPCPRCGAAL